MRGLTIFAFLLNLSLYIPVARAGEGPHRALASLGGWNAPAQNAHVPPRQVKNQEELDAIQAVVDEKDPHKKLALGENFLKRFPNTEVRDTAYGEILVAYAQLGNRAKAIEAGRRAVQNNPDSIHAFFNLGIVYAESPPLDFDQGVWDMARAVALARTAQDKSTAELESALTKVYVDFHGSMEGLDGLIAQAGGLPSPPDGFQIPGPKLYGPDGISPESVRQGGLGSCYFHSTIAALAQSNPQLLKDMITENDNGTYTVLFQDGKKETVYPEDLRFARLSLFDRSDGQWVGVLFRAYAQRVLRASLLKGIDLTDMFPLLKPYAKAFVETTDPLLLAYDRSIRAVVDQSGDMDKGKFMALLNEEIKGIPIPDTYKDLLVKSMESAGVFDAVADEVKKNGELFGAYRSVGHGGIPGRVMETFLGHEALGAKIQSLNQVAELLRQVSPKKQPVIAGTTDNPLQELQAQKLLPDDAGAWYSEKHAYTILSYDLQAQTVTLRNPWGEHPKPDGIFTIPLSTFADSFEMIQTIAP
ncbi:MAG TPA: C2 family cysteine protease [Terriglobia bacterium]|nr:C2 family cysteine protease [Terriglobia bacterium]